MREKSQKKFEIMNWIKRRRNVSFLTIVKKKGNRKEEDEKENKGKELKILQRLYKYLAVI